VIVLLCLAVRRLKLRLVDALLHQKWQPFDGGYSWISRSLDTSGLIFGGVAFESLEDGARWADLGIISFQSVYNLLLLEFALVASL